MAILSLRSAMDLENKGGSSFKVHIAGYPATGSTPNQVISMTEILSGVYWPHIRMNIYIVGPAVATPQNLAHVYDLVQFSRNVWWTQTRTIGIGRLTWSTLDVSMAPLRALFEAGGGQPFGAKAAHNGLPTLCGKYEPKALTALVPKSSTTLNLFVLQALESSGVSYGDSNIAIMIGQACDQPGNTQFIGSPRSLAHELGHDFWLSHSKDGYTADACMDLEWPLVIACRKYNLMTQGAATSGVVGTFLTEAQRQTVRAWMKGHPSRVFSMPGFTPPA